MKIIEDIFKNRFKNQQTQQGIDADDLWQEIAGELGHEQAPPRYKWRSVKWSALLFILLVCGGLIYFSGSTNDVGDSDKDAFSSNGLEMTSSPDTDAGSTISPATEASETTSQLPQSADSSTAGQNNETSSITAIENTKNISSQINQQLKQTSTKNKPEQQVSNIANIVESSPKENLSIKDRNKSGSELVDTKKAVGQNQTKTTSKDLEVKSKSQSTDSNNSQKESRPIFDVQFLPLLPSLPVPLLDHESKKVVLNFQKTISLPKARSNNTFEFAAYTGINKSFNQFKGNDNAVLRDELNNATSPKFGFSTALRLSWINQKKYALRTGIDYEDIQFEFYAVKEKEQMVLRENYLVNFSLDPINGDTINQQYDDVMLNALGKRTVLHRNHFRLIALPLEFGIQQQVGKIGLGINLGIGANFFIDQSGKTLDDQGEIYTIGNKLPFKQFFFSYYLNPFVDVEIAERWKLRLNPVFKYQSHGKSNLYGLSQHAFGVGINGGIVFRL